MLKRLFVLIPLLAMIAQPAQEASGKWNVKFDGDLKNAPKTVTSMTLDLTLQGKTVSGTVEIGSWPGMAPITDGTFENGHLTFTATGTRSSSTGIPTCAFDITVDGDTMHVSLRVLKNPSLPLPANREFHYVGTKLESTISSVAVRH